MRLAACIFGIHSYEYKRDLGLEKAPVLPSGGKLYYPDVVICCGKCGKKKHVDEDSYAELPTLLSLAIPK